MFEKKYGNSFKMNIFEWIWFNLRIKFSEFNRNANPFSNQFRRDIFNEIIFFYAHKNGFKSRKEVEKNLNSLGFIKLHYSFGYIHIYLRHPGLIIGRRGENINSLENHFKQNWKFYFPFKGFKIHEYRECEVNLMMYGFEDDEPEMQEW